MRISPYVAFNGNCAEALAFYEKAFGAKPKIVRYKDAPADADYQPAPGTEDLVMHADLKIGGEMIMCADMPPEYSVKIGDNITIMAEFDSLDAAKKAFDVLKEGGKVDMELQKTFWSACFGSLTDKFGISWNISVQED